MIEVRSVDVLQDEGRASVRSFRPDVDVPKGQALHMPEEEAVGRHHAVAARLWVEFFVFGGFDRGIRRGSAAFVEDPDIAQVQVLDGVVGKGRDQGAGPRIHPRGHDIADRHATKRSRMSARGTAIAGSQTDIDRGIAHIPHGDVRDCHILEDAAVDGFQGQAPAIVEGTVRYGHVLVPAIGLCAELDPALGAGLVVKVSGLPFESAPEEGADIKPAHMAIGDRDVLAGPVDPEPKGALQANPVVVRGIHIAIGDRDIPAAVDVHSVSDCVDLQVVEGQDVGRDGEYPKPAPVKHGEVPQGDIPAVFEGNGLVGHAGRGLVIVLGIMPQGLALDQAWALDRDVFQGFAPDQGIVPMTVTVVLVGALVLLRVGLGLVVGGLVLGGGDDRTRVQVEDGVTLKVNGA